MFAKKFGLLVLGLVVAFSLTGCGGSSSPVSVAVTASASTVDATDAVTLSAVVTNDKNAGGVTWSVSGGGTLSNSTTSAATYTAPAASSTALTVTVTATSVADTTKSGTATLTVPAAPAITTGALAAGAVGTAYSATMAGSGGIAPYTWTLTSGTWPAGLGMNSAGVISGTPTAAGVGTTNLTFQLKDSGTATALTATQTLGLTINAAPAIAFTGAMPATGTYNVAYAGSAAASGGAGTLTYSVTSGSALPSWLSLNTATGAVTGTPSTAASVGTFTFKITAADAFGDSATASYTIVVSYPKLTITSPVTLPVGYGGTAYTQTLTATGGSGAGYSWTVTSGASSLAAVGLSLSGGGVLSGATPVVGTASFGVQVTDSASNTGTATLSVTINAGLAITTPAALPSGYGNTAYSQALATSGGSGAGLAWTVTSGASSLTAVGLSLSGAGVVSGTTPVAGSASFTAKVTDSAGNTANQTFSVTINPGLAITTTSPLPLGYVGFAYTQTLASSGGTGTGLSWSVASGASSLTAVGLSLSGTGVVSGATPVAGTASFTAKVTDSANNVATQTFSLTINGPLKITSPATLPAGYVGSAYSQTLTASGGSGTGQSWTVTSGASSLTAVGLSLSGTGVLSGATPVAGTASFTVKVTDSISETDTATLSVTIGTGLTITSANPLPSGYGGTAYTDTLTSGGGSGSGLSWTVTSGGSSLTAVGLSLSGAGVLSGATPVAGTANFSVKLTDSASNIATATFSVTINPALTITSTSPLTTGWVGTAYSDTLTSSGGTGSGLSWTVTSGASSLTALGLSLSGAGVLSGATPVAGTASFTVKLTDSASNIATATLAVTINAALAITSPATLQGGSAGVAYSQTLVATGGSGTGYNWTVTSGGSSLTAVGLNLSAGGVLSGATPVAGTANFTAKVTDSASNTTSQTFSVMIVAGAQIQGQISLANSCGGSSTLPTFTVTLTTTSGGAVVQTQTTDTNGNYTFTGIPNGTYTITPSISGPESAFYPATYGSLAVSGGNLTNENFNVLLGYMVSGTVTYSGSSSGQVYLTLNSNNCGGGGGALGTSITKAALTAGGAFSIRGVPPGSYTLNARMVTQGYGVQNAVDPVGSISETVTTASISGANVTLSDPTLGSAAPPQIQEVMPSDQGVIIAVGYPTTDTNGYIESDTSYIVQWSTDPTFSSGISSATFAATGSNGPGVWIIDNQTSGVSGSFSNGTKYYFRARGYLVNTSNQSAWAYWGTSSSPTGVTIGQPSGSGYNTITGTVYIPSTVTINSGAQLFVGYYSQSSGIFATRVANPVNTSGGNAFTVYVPNGTYQAFGILDQNNDGMIDVGDVQNATGNSSTIAISGGLTGQNMTLPAVNSTPKVMTAYWNQIYSTGSSTGYELTLVLKAQNKLPVAVTLTAGPNIIYPVDLSSMCEDCGGGGNVQFQFSTSLGTVIPTVGQSYSFLVTYSDGTSETVTGAVNAVLTSSQLATNLLPLATSSSTQPTFTWTYPSSPSSYIYQFDLRDNTANNDIWDIPGNGSKSYGFAYSDISGASITWNVDPTNSKNKPSESPLVSGRTYYWYIQTQDSNGNTGQQQVYFVP